MAKEVVVIRLNSLVLEWYKQKAKQEKMTKSEYIRKILTQYKDNHNDTCTNN
jgi:predicted DNA binding CopG/RHH family protein